MSPSLLSRPRTALWPAEPKRVDTHRNTMSAAVLAAIAIECALITVALSVRIPAAVPTLPVPVMQMRFVEKVAPPPEPVVRQIVKQKSEAPSPEPATAPVPEPRHTAKPRHTPAPHRAARRVPVPIPTPATNEPPPPAAAASTAPVDPAPTPTNTPRSAPVGAPASADIAIVCPVQAKPEMPPRAVAEGIAGKVTARATILGGKVTHVDIIHSTPPGVFDSSVRRAMSAYRCQVKGEAPVVVEQSFDFAETDE